MDTAREVARRGRSRGERGPRGRGREKGRCWGLVLEEREVARREREGRRSGSVLEEKESQLVRGRALLELGLRKRSGE